MAADEAMASKIEDYALVGDLHTAALIGKDGSIDWLCVPRFDAGACFCALLGGEQFGCWQLAPEGPVVRMGRRYLPDTLVLETEFETPTGVVQILDFMPPRSREPDLVRIVVGVRGSVRMRLRCRIRFDYGSVIPWLTHSGRGVRAVAGPDTLELSGPLPLRVEDQSIAADLEVREGQRLPFVLTWFPSHQARLPPPIDAERMLAHTIDYWQRWARRCAYKGPYRDAVLRSLITLRALIYAPTGGLVAAVTSSLPEQWGGQRNWDYRHCWLRDATFTLYALVNAGYAEEARAWRGWLLRAVAGDPAQLQIMYGLSGERRLTEMELPWLPGYEGARPVRVGNAAYQQLQLDVFGEVMDLLHGAARVGLTPDPETWSLQCVLLAELAGRWREPDEGIWEVRGGRRHFTHSKIMAWVAFDRGIKTAERFGLEAPLADWRRLRQVIHDDVCERGFNRACGAFTQYYGASALDASLLAIPHLGFLPVTDARVRGTVAAIRRELSVDGLVLRYTSDAADDGLPPGEGAFLLCTFWLADDLALLGEHDAARALFEHLIGLRNDVGLLSEQYDPRIGRMLGNFPQAFSHVALINTALNLDTRQGPSEQRPQR